LPVIALHKNFVTVRQIFSDDPASESRADPNTSAVFPFFLRGCPALRKNTDEARASIKRFNLQVS